MQRLMPSCGLRADRHQRHNSFERLTQNMRQARSRVLSRISESWFPCRSPGSGVTPRNRVILKCRHFHTSLLPKARSLETVYPPCHLEEERSAGPAIVCANEGESVQLGGVVVASDDNHEFASTLDYADDIRHGSISNRRRSNKRVVLGFRAGSGQMASNVLACFLQSLRAWRSRAQFHELF